MNLDLVGDEALDVVAERKPHAARVVEEEQTIVLVPVRRSVARHNVPVGINRERADFRKHPVKRRATRPSLEPKEYRGLGVQI